MRGIRGFVDQMRIRQIVYFTLIVNDEIGDRVTEGGHKVSVHQQFLQGTGVWEVGAPGNQLASTWEALAVEDNGDGSYTFHYRPMQRGVCRLSVIVEDQPINGSPFKWQVQAVLPHQSRFN